LYDCGSKYLGAMLNKKPHGKGVLYINKKSPAYDHKFLTDKSEIAIIEA
jgi:hypothetical protein